MCERKELAEVSQTLVMFGQGIGAFVFTSLSDRFGRKIVHIACHVTLFGIALITAFVPNFTSFAVMRILTGAFQQVRKSFQMCSVSLIQGFHKDILKYK